MDSQDDSPERPRPDPRRPWGEQAAAPAAPAVGEGRERIFNAPVLALLVAASIPALYYLQARQPDDVELIYRFGLIPRALAEGAWIGLVSHMLLHGGWLHAIMNAVGALAFGTPTARLMTGLRGAFGFLSLYIVCGVIAGGGYALLHIDSAAPLVGASGAVFGLIGAATRLIAGRGRLAPLFHPAVLTSAATWIGVNVVFGVLGATPGADGAPVAWEAHIIGLIAGLILIGPWLRLFGGFDSRAVSRDAG